MTSSTENIEAKQHENDHRMGACFNTSLVCFAAISSGGREAGLEEPPWVSALIMPYIVGIGLNDLPLH